MKAQPETLLDLENDELEIESSIIERSEFDFTLDMPVLLVRKRVFSVQGTGLVEQVLEGSFFFEIVGRQWNVVSEDWRLISRKVITCTPDAFVESVFGARGDAEAREEGTYPLNTLFLEQE